MRIHQLPPAIANQIAAGEVIERPASVVKELLENSLDAGSTNIAIEISYGGLNQIKISDNGSGIVAEDLPLAVAAHATSKINTLDDLYAIDSMGFRGEALASIASVAKLTISSRPPHQEHAMMVRVLGTELSISPCARNIGTTIDVVDLFYNAPVRKRFLRSEKLEFQSIEMVIKRFALSAPHIALTLKHNNKLIVTLPAALSEQAKLARVTKIFGTAFMKAALSLDVVVGSLSLRGWLSGSEYQRSQNDRQWVYINQRMVKDKLLNHAIKQAYDGWLYPGRFPACLLYLNVKSEEVDVNVHPTKHEVRFQHPRLVHDFFTSQLSKVLSLYGSKSTTHQYEIAGYPTLVQGIEICEPFLRESSCSNSADLLKGKDFVLQEKNKTYITHDHLRNLDTIPSFREDASPSKNPGRLDKLGLSQSELPWVVLNRHYVLLFIKHIPYIINIIALQAKWIKDQLRHSELPLINRPLLVPIDYSLPLQIKTNKEHLKTCLAQLGLQIEFSKENNVIIRGVPIILPHLNIQLFLNSVVGLESLEVQKLMDILCQSQVVDAKHFTIEERTVLNQYLVTFVQDDNEAQQIYKALTIEDCRKLFHV